jgi:tetratricopeptide (TPR) repeat protein
VIGLLVIAQLVVVAHAPGTAPICAPIEITVAARAPGTLAPQISPLMQTASVQVLKSSVVSRVERDGQGQPTALTEATFIVAAGVSGRVVLPPFTARLGAQRASAVAPPFEVHANDVLPPSVIVRAWLDRAGHGTSAETLYVGQQVDYVVDVELNESARERLRRNPTFFPPEMPGVLAYDLAPPATIARAGRRCFETLSYRRALFPLFAGRAAIAPATLTYSLPLSTSFFSREENFELSTDSVRFIAVDVPVLGRPADFAGAVGEVGASWRLSTPRARMGDPVVLTLRLEGSGNVKLWPRPTLHLGWASVADGEERVQVDTAQARVRGSTEFDWLLTPRQPGQQEVPPMDYPYFDPDRGAYANARTPPLTLDVAPALLSVLDSTPVSRIGIRRTIHDELPLPMPSRRWYWLLLALAPVPAALRRARDKARARTERRSAARQLRQAATRSEHFTARELRRLYLEAVGDRVPGAIRSTQPSAFSRALRFAGVTEETADAASGLFERLDAAAFSPAGAIDGGVVSEACALVAAIDAEAVRPALNTLAARKLVLLFCFLASAQALNALPEGAANTFRQGVEAFDHSDFTASERLFGRVAARAPRAVDAWANLGTAALSRGDSAGAVRAWQRSLRLDPLDIDSRDRLEAVVPASMRAPGYVPPLPVNMLALAALAGWIGAWLLLALSPASRPRNGRALAGGALSVAVVLLLAALEINDRLDSHGLAVLRRSRPLVEAPGSSTAVATGNTGETGRLGAREGAWVRIALDGARAGWVPAASLLTLDEPPG